MFLIYRFSKIMEPYTNTIVKDQGLGIWDWIEIWPKISEELKNGFADLFEVYARVIKSIQERKKMIKTLEKVAPPGFDILEGFK